jgi:hypothetical protein
MKILRSVTRRGYTVGTAGMFTIVSPNRWFAASQFPESFQGLGGRSKEAPESVAAGQAPDRAAGPAAAMSPQIMILSTSDRRPMRFALIALLAAAIALCLLWWFFHIAVGGIPCGKWVARNSPQQTHVVEDQAAILFL